MAYVIGLVAVPVAFGSFLLYDALATVRPCMEALLYWNGTRWLEMAMKPAQIVQDEASRWPEGSDDHDGLAR